jgi:parallel beta-helix repeat protein
MARLPSPGGDDNQWGDILNAYLAVSLDSTGNLNNNVVGTNQIQSNAVTNAQLDSATQTTLASVAGKYTKPGTGIPGSDMTSAVQASLSKADSSLQSGQLGTANGIATLDGSSKLTGSQLPSSVANAIPLPINVKGAAYGALGNGTTDDAAAIQAALTAAGTAGGGRVVIPAGIYIIGTQLNIPSGVAVVGELAGERTTVTNTGRASVLKAKTGTSLAAVLATDNAEGVLIRDLVIDGQDLATAAVSIGAYQSRIEDCEIKRGATYGLVIEPCLGGAHECTVRDNLISQNAQGTGIYVKGYDSTPSPAQTCSDNLIQGNVVRGATTCSIYVERSGGNQILDNHIYEFPAAAASMLAGIMISGGSINQIRGNYIDNIGGGPAITIQVLASSSTPAYSTHVTDNMIYTPGLSGSQYAILINAGTVTNGVWGIRIANTIVETDDAVSVRYAAVLNTVVSGGGSVAGISLTGTRASGATKLFNGSRPTMLASNQRATTYFDGAPTFTENGGNATLSFDGSTTSFTVAHGLETNPRTVSLCPTNSPARNAGLPSVGMGTTNLTLTFLSAPATATATYAWRAEC